MIILAKDLYHSIIIIIIFIIILTHHHHHDNDDGVCVHFSFVTVINKIIIVDFDYDFFDFNDAMMIVVVLLQYYLLNYLLLLMWQIPQEPIVIC